MSSTCKGLLFRVQDNSYYKDGCVHIETTARLLKRKSCKGCPDCGWMHDALEECSGDELSDLFQMPEIIDGRCDYHLVAVRVESDDYYFRLEAIRND